MTYLDDVISLNACLRLFVWLCDRSAAITDNEFAWLGESGVVIVGDTDGMDGYPGFGVNGSAGNQVLTRGSPHIFHASSSDLLCAV